MVRIAYRNDLAASLDIQERLIRNRVERMTAEEVSTQLEKVEDDIATLEQSAGSFKNDVRIEKLKLEARLLKKRLEPAAHAGR